MNASVLGSITNALIAVTAIVINVHLWQTDERVSTLERQLTIEHAISEASARRVIIYKERFEANRQFLATHFVDARGFFHVIQGAQHAK